MKTVGIRELKAKLSEYLRRVQEGETVTVTDRGKTVARLGPGSDYPDLGAFDGSSLVRDPGAVVAKAASTAGIKRSSTKKAPKAPSFSALLKKAQAGGKHSSQKETLTAALQSYVDRQNRMRIAEAFGQIEYEPGYDYKEQRRIK